ncbi:MAG: ion channel [Cyanobacteria bacterium J06621_11]
MNRPNSRYRDSEPKDLKHKEKYKFLLISLCTTFFVAPFLKGTLSQLFFPLLLLSTIVSLARSFALNRVLLIAYTAIAALAYILILSAELGWVGASTIRYGLIAQGIFILYLGGAAYWIGKDIFTAKEVTADTIRGGISVYLLIGFVWALFYGLVAATNPDAFSQPMFTSAGEASSYQKTFHFSFTTLTTLGYGDIVPVSDIALVLTNLEAIVGQMYSTVFIAILVGGYLSRRE